MPTKRSAPAPSHHQSITSPEMDRLPPMIYAQLKFLLENSPFPVKIDGFSSGCHDSKYADRFSLLVPFCLGHVRFDVMYNALFPLGAPDIMFEEEDSNFNPFLMITDRNGDKQKTKSCLSDWNYKDPSMLMHLIHELRSLYMSYQQTRIEELDDPRLKFELGTILAKEGVEVRLFLEKEKVKFAIPLLDNSLNKLVPDCQWKELQNIYLQVIFSVNRKKTSVPPAPHFKLISTPELKELFSVDDVILPPWENGMCVSVYLPSVEHILGGHVMKAVASVNARRRFIEALSASFGRPVEADPVIFCRRATVVANSGVFTFLVHFFISNQFPKKQPVLVLQSSQHFDAKLAPVKSGSLSNYPWSPRWSVQEMAERIFCFLAEESENFKKFAAAHNKYPKVAS